MGCRATRTGRQQRASSRRSGRTRQPPYGGTYRCGTPPFALPSSSAPSPLHLPLQFATLENRTALLYLNWQPHYAAGFIDLEEESPPGRSLRCCVMLRDHWEGPHDEERVAPLADPAPYAAPLRAALIDARDAARSLGGEPPVQPHWWGQVRYRRFVIYCALLLGGLGFALKSAAVAFFPTHRWVAAGWGGLPVGVARRDSLTGRTRATSHGE